MADQIPGLPAGFVLDDPPPVSVLSSGSRTLPAGFSLDTPDLLPGATDTAARWATFGLTDPVDALARAGVHKLFGDDKSFGDLYQRNLAEDRGRAANFATEHPYVNGAAALAGALTPTAPRIGAADLAATPLPGATTRPFMAPPTPVPGGNAGGSLVRRTLTGAATGAGIGAAEGVSNSQQTDPMMIARDAGISALGGSIAGGALPVFGELVKRPAQAVARRILPNAAEDQGAALLASRVGQDKAAGGPGASDLAQALASAGPSPLSIADVGGANVQGFAGKLTRMVGQAKETAEKFLADRSSGMAPRLIQNIDDNLAGGNAFHAAETLINQRKTDAAPLYEAAYAHAPLNPDYLAETGELTQLMQRPSMRDAAGRALKIAQEEGRDPASLGLAFNEAGDPVFQRVPSWQTLDYVKRGLDDVLNSFRNPLTGKLVLDEGGRAIDATRRGFLSFLDQNNPPFAAARQAWAGPSEALAAMKQGQNFREMRPELIQQTLSGMSPSEQEFFRLGAADKLRTSVNDVGTATPLIGSNAVNQRGAQGKIDQLRPLFPSQDSFDRFVQNASNENLIFANTAKLTGNSLTAGRLAEDAGHGSGAGSALLGVGAGAAAIPHEPLAGSMLTFRSLARLLSELGETKNPQVNAAAARMMFSADPAANAGTLASILARRPSATPMLSAPSTAMAGSLYPQYAFSPFAEKPKVSPGGAP